MDDENLDKFFGHTLRLVNESDRRFNYANEKVAKNMVSRVKSAKNSLTLIKIASSVIANSFSVDRKEKLESHLINLLELWKSKLSATINYNISNNFSRYKAQPLRSGMVGRPSLNVNTEQVNVLREYHFNWTQIENIMDIHRSTLWRKLKKYGYNIEEKYSTISPEELNREIIAIKEEHPLIGEKMVIGFLRSKGLCVQRSRVRDSIHTVDPFNCINRWL